MSDSGDERPQQGRRRGNAEEKELASQQIQIQSKRFYIDVKENQRGRFIKLAEVGVGGRKSRIMMSMSAAVELKQRLGEFSELHAQLGPSAVKKEGSGDGEAAESSGGNNEGGVIKSESIVKDRKRYYLDLKENQRGRFLRISMVLTRGPRPFLAIPAQGLIEFKDHLTDMLDRYAAGYLDSDQSPQSQQQSGANGLTSDGVATTATGELPESKSFRADNKMFYFDCGSNQRGVFLKISEVRQNRYRSSITVPDKQLEQFRDHINEYLAKINLNDNSQSPAADGTTTDVPASTNVEETTTEANKE